MNSILRKDSPFSGQLYPFRFMHPREYEFALINAGFHIEYLETTSRTYRNFQEKFEFIVVEAKKPHAPLPRNLLS